MSGERTLIIDRLTLRLPRAAARNAKAVAREIGRALAAQEAASRARLAAVADPPRPGEANPAFARRVAQATVTAAKRGGGDAG